jgi:hypothetical protein
VELAHLLLYPRAQPADTFANLFWPSVGESQVDMRPGYVSGGVKGSPGTNGKLSGNAGSEYVRSGQAACKGNHLRVLCDFQQFADVGSLSLS